MMGPDDDAGITQRMMADVFAAIENYSAARPDAAAIRQIQVECLLCL